MGATLGQPPPIGCRSCWPPATTTCWSARTGTVARPTCSPRLPAPLPAGWNGAASGPGAHGERDDDWTAVALDPTGLPDGWGRWLLVRRQTHPGDGKQYRDLAFYRCAGPAATPLRELIHVAGARWAIESASRPGRPTPGSTTTRSATTEPGTPTSPWACTWVAGGLSESWAGGSATSRRRKASPLTRPAPRSSCPRRPRATAVHDPGGTGAIFGAGAVARRRMTPVRCSLAGRMATAWASTLPAAGVVGAAASWLAARGTGGVIAVAVGGLVLAKAMYAASRRPSDRAQRQ
jgi:hypothetical protein